MKCGNGARSVDTSRGDGPESDSHDRVLGLLASAMLEGLDPSDPGQLAHVVAACRGSRSLSEAGRTLFAASRARRSSSNDADRLRKYLARFGLSWAELGQG